MSSAWWVGASPQSCWPLVCDAGRWPGWWQAMAQVSGLPAGALPSGRLRHWRVLLGRPLHLRVRLLRVDRPHLIEWQIGGDMSARLTWVLDPASPDGCDMTCRWDIEPMAGPPRWLRSLAFLAQERSHAACMRACAQGMGLQLGCNTTRLRQWCGLSQR